MNMATSKSTSTSTTTSNPECDNCHSRQRWVLHHVRLKGVQRRLCTNCVLCLHPSSFCPSCFQVYDSTSSSNPNPPPHPSKRITCVKCSSISHSHCLSSSLLSPSSPYFCPPCANPNFSFYDSDYSRPGRTIDKKMALVFLCAARIASVSMSKAVIVAKVDAERRVREAVVARKRAKEAMDHVALLHTLAKDRSVEVTGSENVSKEKNLKLKVDNSNMAKLTDVGVKVQQPLDGVKGQNVMLASQKNEVTMDVKELDEQKMAPDSGMDHHRSQNNRAIEVKERLGNFRISESTDVEKQHLPKSQEIKVEGNEDGE